MRLPLSTNGHNIMILLSRIILYDLRIGDICVLKMGRRTLSYHPRRAEWNNLALNPNLMINWFSEKLLSIVQSIPEKPSNDYWKDQYFKKNPSADTDRTVRFLGPSITITKKCPKAKKKFFKMSIGKTLISKKTPLLTPIRMACFPGLNFMLIKDGFQKNSLF